MNTGTFSAAERASWLSKLETDTFDLLIIGGGITGAGIALDAATRGLKVALVEKKDFAWGTSSRSTKLIHGGLRYLKQLEFALVHEVGVERAIVHANAPHIVIPEKMLLPIIEEGSLGKTLSSIGLWVYDRLASVEKDERRKMLEKEVVADLEPLLRPDLLLGGGLYYEYRTDDARLTIENMKTAVANGAVCLNYLEATEFIYKENGYVGGAVLNDHLSNQTIKVKARRVVNAAGPWVDTVRKNDKEGVVGKRLHLTKGVHVVVPYQKLPLQQSVYFDVKKDNRMCFAIPRGNITYIGTTDTFYDTDINQPNTTKEDVEYILEATNYMFPTAQLDLADVESSWAGLRPLIHQDGKSPSELSRRDEIFYSETGLISIAGGKLTGYRKMAERVLNFVAKTMRTKNHSKTQDLTLSGGDFDSSEAIQDYIYKITGEAKQIDLKTADVQALVYKYGTNTELIINRAYELYNSIRDPHDRLMSAEVWYAIHYEMTNNLCDFFIRRTGRLYFERPTLKRWYPYVANEMAKILAWSEERKSKEVEDFEKEYHAVLSFRK
ncbi:glycerol-3-phosphate dehydrogenase/oxidase [Aureispira anguillae]|uniref:Glycerol-3-phosphate dehydrogenase n=1 Tax=Aureispira anguillae TaxID=2864201 RepID=A0A915YFR1_9BACT|nr:glycerol-3-phosphate dehydrogenase/oxidase [Aureispira anguillae]BDS12298.1 glycerol-3-phosphate dehydrogenase/oxidase [Aureispira anguillae]